MLKKEYGVHAAHTLANNREGAETGPESVYGEGRTLEKATHTLHTLQFNLSDV